MEKILELAKGLETDIEDSMDELKESKTRSNLQNARRGRGTIAPIRKWHLNRGCGMF